MQSIDSEHNKQHRQASYRFEVGTSDGVVGRFQTRTEALTVALEYYLDASGLYVEDREPVLKGWPILWCKNIEGALEVVSRKD